MIRYVLGYQHGSDHIMVEFDPGSDFSTLQEELICKFRPRSHPRVISLESSESATTDEWADCDKYRKSDREQLVQFLQAILHVEKQPKCVRFSDSFPLEAFYAVLTDGRVHDVEFDWSDCVCTHPEDDSQIITALRKRASMSSALTELMISWSCRFFKCVGEDVINDPQVLVEWILPACPELEHFVFQQDRETCKNDWDLDNPLACKQKWWDIISALPKLKELHIEIMDKRLFGYFWEALAECPRSPKKIKMAVDMEQPNCDVIARYLRQPYRHECFRKPVQELEINMGVFFDEEENEELDLDHEKAVAMLLTLARALEDNNSLVSFSLLRNEFHEPVLVVDDGAIPFEQALRTNTRLAHLTLDYADPEDSEDTETNIQMLLKLNNAGRAHLMDFPSNKVLWVHSLWEFRDDLNSVFFLLQSNPTLCDTQRYVGEDDYMDE